MSFFGQLTTLIPLSRVASVTAGVKKPVEYLIVAAFLLLGGFLGCIWFRVIVAFAIVIIIAGVLIVYYFLSKSILLQVSSNAGPEISVRFRPGVIEGVPVDAEKALAAVGVIRDLIVLKVAGEILDEPWTITRNNANVGVQQSEIVHQTVQPPPSPITEPTVDRVPVPVQSDERIAHEALVDAVRLFKAGSKDAAVAALTKVVRLYPSTSAAQKAQSNLESIRLSDRTR